MDKESIMVIKTKFPKIYLSMQEVGRERFKNHQTQTAKCLIGFIEEIQNGGVKPEMDSESEHDYFKNILNSHQEEKEIIDSQFDIHMRSLDADMVIIPGMYYAEVLRKKKEALEQDELMPKTRSQKFNDKFEKVTDLFKDNMTFLDIQ